MSFEIAEDRDLAVTKLQEQAAKDREALYAALDMIEEIVTNDVFVGFFSGETRARFLALNAERKSQKP